MLDGFSNVAQVIISIAAMLFSGFLLSRVTKLLKLPNVTGYIIAGILIGPYCFNIIPEKVTIGMDFIADIALAFIAFGTGEFFRFSTIKKNGSKVIIITIFEAIMASIVVFIFCFFVLKLNLAFSLLLSALAQATAPASTLMTIRQTGARGDFVDTLLQVVALDDVVGLLGFSIAVSAASALISQSFSFDNVIMPIIYNLLALIVGALLGLLLSFLMKRHSNDNRLIIAIAMIFSFCGMCVLFDVSPLLGCMMMGTIYINKSNDDKLFKQLNYFSPPILLLFFVRSGVNFKLNLLFDFESAINGIPLLVVGLVYFITRIIGKYLGAFLGCLSVKKNKLVRNYLGLALIPQAGVAIGLASLAERVMGGSLGSAIATIILASSVLYELIGPACSKLSLYLSHSYGNIEIKEEKNVKKEKVLLEELLNKLDEIKKQIPEAYYDEEEEAFTDAAYDYYYRNNNYRRRRF